MSSYCAARSAIHEDLTVGRPRMTESLNVIARSAYGDARRALTTLEVAATQSRGKIDAKAAEEALQHKTPPDDQAGEEHYNVVSAFIKSMRGSDPDAAVYWMVRMLEAEKSRASSFAGWSSSLPRILATRIRAPLGLRSMRFRLSS